jgi:hypothetical protein
MSNEHCLHEILIPEDNILKTDDATLKDRIAKLSKLLEQDNLSVDEMVMIKYNQILYSKFTKENGI